MEDMLVNVVPDSNKSSFIERAWPASDHPEMGRSLSDMSLLMCHESSPIDEEIVQTTVSILTAPLPAPCSSSIGAVCDNEACDASVPITVALAGLDSSLEARRSFADPVLLYDRRVLLAMLSLDDQCLPSAHYFKYTQPDLLPFMRKVVVTWMLEVCEEQQCEEEVFPLAVNYLDRVLSVLQVKRSQLQLLATVCMFISSKFKDTTPLAAQSLVIYTDNSITIGDLLEWELIVLQALKWEISAVTPHDFLEYIVSRLPLNIEERTAVRRHTKTFIALCTSDFKFVVCPPSMVAAACVIAAATGLLGETRCRHLKLIDHLRNITAIDPECLRQCQEQIEESLRASMSGTAASSSASANESTSGDGKPSRVSGNAVLPSTPTDVREIDIVDK